LKIPSGPLSTSSTSLVAGTLVTMKSTSVETSAIVLTGLTPYIYCHRIFISYDVAALLE
jgi:hypothetical protein